MSTLKSLLIGAVAVLGATGTLSAQAAHPKGEVRHDRRELRADRHEVRQDRREVVGECDLEPSERDGEREPPLGHDPDFRTRFILLRGEWFTGSSH
jgi:hypothetical protein